MKNKVEFFKKSKFAKIGVEFTLNHSRKFWGRQTSLKNQVVLKDLRSNYRIRTVYDIKHVPVKLFVLLKSISLFLQPAHPHLRAPVATLNKPTPSNLAPTHNNQGLTHNRHMVGTHSNNMGLLQVSDKA